MENTPPPATGFNPDPEAEKPAGAAELMTPDNAPGPEGPGPYSNRPDTTDPEDVEGDLDMETEAGL
ncbi:hypothetical protein GCM10023189_22300 [Nibrella saemangeumensis]|uniref:Uncharacterized protein n=1 Tax=Nibrella saemangeumensis TaxID=1084526 RepID=A0ABP8MUC3_9BACT